MRPTDREADPISEHLTRRNARLTSVDVRARRYALRSVQPSPARQDAPEPNAWLPIDLTAELAELDFTGELELLEIEEGAVDLDRELAELEADFWRTAEHEHPFLTGLLPGEEAPAAATSAPTVEAADVVEAPVAPSGSSTSADVAAAPISLFRAPPPEPSGPVAPVPAEAHSTPAHAVPAPPAVEAPDADGAELEPLPVPEAYAQLRPNRPAIAHHRRTLRLRRRLIVTALVVVCGAALVGVAGQVLGGTHPRRDVTVSIDGQASTIVTRSGTVGDLLASRGIVLREGDRVVPAAATALEQGMPIQVFRAFPMTADVDGVVVAHRTTRHDVNRVRRELNLPAGLVRVGAGPIERGSRLVLRTPHDVTLAADGHDTTLPHDTALTVGELLAAQKITLGSTDQVDPALDTRLADAMAIRVYRLGTDTVMADKIIPFRTEYRDDSTLAAGHTATVQAGRNGLSHVFSNVVRKDGQVVQWGAVIREEVVQPPVTQILRRGTKRSGTQVPPPAPRTASSGVYQSGTATWYDSHAGSGSCAHLRLPFGTIVRIVASNGNTAQCRVGDRGPEAWTGNIIDLNRDVFAQLAPLGTGRISVTLSIVGWTRAAMALTPATIPALLQRHGLAPSRALGQNFLADPNTARRIVRLAEVGAGDRVLEIGPGIGSLTVALLEVGARVTAVELDRHVVPALLDTVGDDAIRLIAGDAMTIDLDDVLGPIDDDPWHAVSNLPYNVATPIVMRLLEDAPGVASILVMVQREVGERLAAGPGTKAYGAVSVKVAYYAAARVVGIVPPSVFIPAPRVDSALVRLVRHPTPPVEVPSAVRLFTLVRAGFGQRRKMLRGALRAELGDGVEQTLTTAGIDPRARAETLVLDDWARLARVVG